MRVTPDINKIDSFEICNPPDPTSVQTYPAVCFNGANYVVVWSDEKIGGNSSYYMVVTRVTPQGTVLDTGISISTGSGSSEYRGDIAFDGTRCLAIWPKSYSGLQGRFINSVGQPEGSVITIVSGYTGGVAIDFDYTNYLVVYYTGSYPNLEIYGQRVDTEGNLVGSAIGIATGTGCFRMADVVFDGSKYLVVWMKGDNTSTQEIWGQFVDVDGSLIGNNFRISDSSSNRRWYPAVAVSDVNALVTWHQGTSNYDVYGNTDVSIVEAEEEIVNQITSYGSTIISGPLRLPQGKDCRVLDISGRQIEPDRLRPGIYFIEVDNKITQKVVKIR